MTVSEIFSTIKTHIIEGIMFHDKMADYYDFLGLMGFKRMHEYHFLDEAAEMRGINRYFINRYNMLIPETDVKNPKTIPERWYNYNRKSIDINAKKSAIRSSVESWCVWEHDSKKLYEMCYGELCDIGEVAAACKVKDLIISVDMELKCADRLFIRLENMDYDMPTITMMQDEMHSEYSEKEKEIGVSIC